MLAVCREGSEMENWMVCEGGDAVRLCNIRLPGDRRVKLLNYDSDEQLTALPIPVGPELGRK